MKTYKILFVAMIFFISMFATNVSAENVFTINDGTEDVIDANENFTDYPDVDINQVMVNKDGNAIEFTLKLVEEGKILDSGFIVAYSGYLTTSKRVYEIVYAIADESLGLYEDGVTISAYGFESSAEEGIDVDVKDYSGVGTNTLTINFNLLDNNEICIGLDCLTLTMGDATGLGTYLDQLNLEYDFPIADAGEPYNIKAGNKVTLEGTIDEGSASDYNWLWTIDDTSITYTGQTAEHTYSIPGNYTGTLFVYNDQGQYDSSKFEVNVQGEKTNGGGNNNGGNNQPGFEMIAVIAAIGIALILLRKRK